MSYIRRADLTVHDVLLGRGARNQHYAGTAFFRDQVVAPRRDEYTKTKSRTHKTQIAVELIDYLRQEVDPPGRFLRSVYTQEEKEAAGLVDAEEGEIFVVVEDAEVIDRVKASLRNKGSTPKDSSTKDKPASPDPRPERTGPAAGKDRTDGATTAGAVGDTGATTTSTATSTATATATTADAVTSTDSADDQEQFANDLRELVLGDLGNASDDTDDQLWPDGDALLCIPDLASDEDNNDLGGAANIDATTPEVAAIEGKLGAPLLSMMPAALRYASSLRIFHDQLASTGELSDERRRHDLLSLGQTIYQHFLGQHAKPPDGNVLDKKLAVLAGLEGTASKRHASTDAKDLVPLQELGIPVCLCLVVTSLLNAEKDGACHRYGASADVEKDLRLMMALPDRYFIDDPTMTALKFTSTLYGRESELERLHEIFENTVGSAGGRKLLCITGRSGTGKTALVDKMAAPLARKQGHFVRGKFDELGQVLPLSVIFSAFDSYCHDIAEENGPVTDAIRGSLEEELGESANALTGLMPSLKRLIKPRPTFSDESCTDAINSANRAFALFKLYVKAISSPSHPIVLFFDDIQWADQASLDMLATVMLTEQVGSLLVIYCYRDNEIGPDHPLQRQLEDYVSSDVSVSSIPVNPIDLDATNDMVSSVLQMPLGIARPLASLIQAKSEGNVFGIHAFMWSLVDDGLLRYSASLRTWEWDVDEIQKRELSDNIADLVREKILKANHSTQFFLKVAACLGQGFNDVAIRLLGLQGSVDTVVGSGFMYRHEGAYRFSHDKIQEASYALLEPSESVPFHFLLGKKLWKSASVAELDGLLFTIVEQLHRGLSIVESRPEKHEIARLCLSAGKKASKIFAFVPASIYYLYGCACLDESDWDSEHNLCFTLSILAAEGQYATGSNEMIQPFLEPVLLRCKNMEEVLRTKITIIYALIALGKNEALSVALPLLGKLGQEMPTSPTKEYLMKEFAKTRAMIQNVSTEQLLALPRSTHENEIASMKILGHILGFTYSFHSNPFSSATFIFRMVQLTITSGTFEESAFAVASLGVACLMHGIVDAEVYRYAQVALKILDSKVQLARTYVVCGLVKIFFEPIQALPDFLDKGFDAGMSADGPGYAFAARHVKFILSPLMGSKLGPLGAECEAFVAVLKEYRHSSIETAYIVLQSIQNLLGRSIDPTELTGDVIINQDDFIRGLAKDKPALLLHYYFFRMWLAFIFRNFDVAEEMLTRLESLGLKPELLADGTFYMGLVATQMHYMADQDGTKNQNFLWKSMALRSKEKLENLAKISHWNFSQKARLLAAEIAYKVEADTEVAKLTYIEAITLAGEHKFVHEEAIACELAGLFYRHTGESSVAKEYLKRSQKHYGEWGASAKVDEIMATLEITV